MTSRARLNLARLLVGVVLFWNLQAALAFIINPSIFAPSFELVGVPGAAAIQGFGVLFLMWNVPYAVALWHPLRNRISLYEAQSMQVIGVAGETIIYFSVPLIHATARAAMARFIFFDSLGIILLLLAVLLVRSLQREGASIN